MTGAAIPTIIAALLAFAGSVYAVYAQQRGTRDRAAEKVALAQGEASIKLAAQATDARVDVARDVLAQWQIIVTTLQTEIKHLHEQVRSLEVTERDCQMELRAVLRRVTELEAST